jgi:hypothetical protein
MSDFAVSCFFCTAAAAADNGANSGKHLASSSQRHFGRRPGQSFPDHFRWPQTSNEFGARRSQSSHREVKHGENVQIQDWRRVRGGSLNRRIGLGRAGRGSACDRCARDRAAGDPSSGGPQRFLRLSRNPRTYGRSPASERTGSNESVESSSCSTPTGAGWVSFASAHACPLIRT